MLILFRSGVMWVLLKDNGKQPEDGGVRCQV